MAENIWANGVITTRNDLINRLNGVISPRHKWSEMGPYLSLVSRGPLVVVVFKVLNQDTELRLFQTNTFMVFWTGIFFGLGGCWGGVRV